MNTNGTMALTKEGTAAPTYRDPPPDSDLVFRPIEAGWTWEEHINWVRNTPTFEDLYKRGMFKELRLMPLKKEPSAHDKLVDRVWSVLKHSEKALGRVMTIDEIFEIVGTFKEEEANAA